MSDKVVLGVDIGGTKVATGLVNEAGQILSKIRVPMVADDASHVAMDCVHRAIGAAMSLHSGPVDAIGVSSPGPLDPETGVILHTPNLPCWRNFPLREEIERAYGLPTLLDNDANAAGLAEAVWGAGQGVSSVFYVTIGTGVGTAIIHDKHIYHGRTGAAAEGGHMTIDFRAPIRCGCGKHGCLESLASGPAIAARAREKLWREGPTGSFVASLSGKKPVTTESVFDSSEAGDPFAQQIVQETADLLAVFLGNIVDLLEPEALVFGGGVGARMLPWLPRIHSQMLQWTINTRASEIPLLPARYGADSGIAGSAALWFSDFSLKEHLSVSKIAQL